MARHKKKLSPLEVGRLAKMPGRHAVGEGLYLMVSPKHAKGACSWAYRYTVAGKAHVLGLGSFPDTTVASARAKVSDLQRQRMLGEDPLAMKRAGQAEQRASDAKLMTFRAAGEAYIESNKSGWKNSKHAAQWAATLKTYVYPLIGDLPVKDVETAKVVDVLEQPSGAATLWADKPETASRIRGRIESILDWARVRGYREGENPARWRGHLDQALPAKSKIRKVQHHPAESIDGIGPFMRRLRLQPGVAACALDFTILTAARTSEALGTRWHEIDLESRIWSVPALRMKGDREHRVPLSAQAVSILTRAVSRPGGVNPNDYVFASASGTRLSAMALLMLLRRMERSDITVHGFRSTFRDWVSERTNFPTEAAELALAHTLDDKVEAAYRRGDQIEKRRLMMMAWAAFCDGVAVTEHGGPGTQELP
jgi:integrase